MFKTETKRKGDNHISSRKYINLSKKNGSENVEDNLIDISSAQIRKIIIELLHNEGLLDDSLYMTCLKLNESNTLRKDIA